MKVRRGLRSRDWGQRCSKVGRAAERNEVSKDVSGILFVRFRTYSNIKFDVLNVSVSEFMIR